MISILVTLLILSKLMLMDFQKKKIRKLEMK